jgi:hypothetical protein
MFRGTFWIGSWSILSRGEGRCILMEGCRCLETCALELLEIAIYL